MISSVPFISTSCACGYNVNPEKCIISDYSTSKEVIIEPGISSSKYIYFNTKVEPKSASQDVVIWHSIYPENSNITFNGHTIEWNDAFVPGDSNEYVL